MSILLPGSMDAFFSTHSLRSDHDSQIIDGNAIAKVVRAQMEGASGVPACGHHRRHNLHRSVRAEQVRACAEAGLYSRRSKLPADTPEETLLARIAAQRQPGDSRYPRSYRCLDTSTTIRS
jgi:hypothetical protein